LYVTSFGLPLLDFIHAEKSSIDRAIVSC